MYLTNNFNVCTDERNTKIKIMSKMTQAQAIKWNKKQNKLERIEKLNLKHQRLNNCIEFYFEGNQNG